MARKPQVTELTEVDRREIQRTQESLQRILGRFDQYEACGVDCVDWRTTAQLLHSELQAFVDHIYEGKPVTPEG